VGVSASSGSLPRLVQESCATGPLKDRQLLFPAGHPSKCHQAKHCLISVPGPELCGDYHVSRVCFGGVAKQEASVKKNVILKGCTPRHGGTL
jgi:hypothetical protein